MIDTCKDQGVKIHVTTHDRTYDPTNGRDRKSLRDDASDAEYSSDETSTRVLRGLNAALAKGRPQGPIPFGYRRDYELRDGRPKPVRQYADPDEAPLVRELYERVLSGQSIRSVALDWQARGITSRITRDSEGDVIRGGVPFSPQALRALMIRPAYAGLRAHKGTTRPAAWPALVDDATFYGVQNLLADKTRRTHTGDGIKHEYTSTIRCDVCSGPLTVRCKRRNGNEIVGYGCQLKGCVRINKAEVDDLLTRVILGYLARPDVYDAISGDDDSGADAVHAELAAKRADLKEMRDAPKPKRLAAVLLLGESIGALEDEIKGLEDRLREITQPNRLAAVFPPGSAADVKKRWEDAPVTTRRAVAALLLSADALGEVRVTRTTEPGMLAPVQDRIVWRTA